MALNTRITNVAAIAACDAIVDLIDAHATLAGLVEIRTGAQPASADAAATGTILASITFNDPAFGAAADAAPGGRATADVTPALQDTSANASGTAGWFRAYQGGGTPAVIDGEVGTAGADMNLDNTSINTGQTVSIKSWTITMPES